MAYTYLKYNIEEEISFITLNYPQRKNVLDGSLISELKKAFSDAQRDSRVKVVILKSTGDNFSIGMDEEYLQKIAQNDFTQNIEELSSVMRLFEQIYTIRKPVIALVQGPALSNGFGLVVVCDIIIAAEETSKFGFTETKHGLAPAISTIYLSRRIGEGRTKEFIINGSIIGALDAFNLGLVSKVVPLAELEITGIKYAKALIDNISIKSIGLIKELLTRIHGMPTTDAIEFACNINALARMSEDFKKLLKKKN